MSPSHAQTVHPLLFPYAEVQLPPNLPPSLCGKPVPLATASHKPSPICLPPVHMTALQGEGDGSFHFNPRSEHPQKNQAESGAVLLATTLGVRVAVLGPLLWKRVIG